MQRKIWKANARTALKKHYWLFVALCLASAILGVECTSSLTAIQQNLPGSGSSQTIDLSVLSTQIVLDSIDQARDLDLEAPASAPETASIQPSPEPESEDAAQNEIFGRTRGVFAMLVNGITSGSYLASLIVGIRTLTGSERLATALFILLALAALFFLTYFVFNVSRVILRRMYLEGRLYEKVPPQRALFLLRIRRWRKAAATLLLQSVYQFLWWLTLVSGAVKHYSYILVPYIVAENPDIGPRETLTLSRRLMKGHKWECFRLELSFLGWDLLGALTLGVTNLFYANPYRLAVMSEYYAYVRSLGKERQVKNAELLNDDALFAIPSYEDLAPAYADVIQAEARQRASFDGLTGIRRFLADTFGLVLWNDRAARQYEKEAEEDARLAYDKEALEGLCYPTRAYPIPEKEKREWIGTLHYMRAYSVWSLILIFFVMSLIGWLWEVLLHLITSGTFVNRGVLHGPWLPIYGSGSVLILLLLNKLRSKPLLEFGGAVVLCGSIEYGVACYLEQAYNGMKWWDYTGYFLNLNGRICAEGLLTFGIGGMLIVYLLAPFLDSLFRRLPKKALVSLCLVLLLAFGADQLYSKGNPNTGEGITGNLEIQNDFLTLEENACLQSYYRPFISS